MKIRRYFTAKEVVSATGVSYRQLDYWVRKGLVRCSGRSATRRGSPRLFTFQDLVEIRVIRSLIEHGMKLSALYECIKELRKKFSEDKEWSFSSMRLVTNGKQVFKYIAEGDVLESIDKYGQFAFTFGLKEQIQHVSNKVNQTKRPDRYSRQNVINGKKLTG